MNTNYLHVISDSADILIVKTSFWNEKRSTHSKGFYIKKIKAEVVLFMKTALFVSKSDSHERRSIKEDQPIFFKSRRQWLVHIFFEIRCSYITQVKIFWWLIPYLRDFHLRIKPTRHLWTFLIKLFLWKRTSSVLSYDMALAGKIFILILLAFGKGTVPLPLPYRTQQNITISL